MLYAQTSHESVNTMVFVAAIFTLDYCLVQTLIISPNNLMLRHMPHNPTLWDQLIQEMQS